VTERNPTGSGVRHGDSSSITVPLTAAPSPCSWHRLLRCGGGEAVGRWRGTPMQMRWWKTASVNGVGNGHDAE
jgi:hypothetical protein